MIDPGPPGGVPSDAIVLFDGNNMDAWDGGEKWKVEDSIATAAGGTITSKQKFGDCQFHLEFATPAEVKGSGQGRGNSGVYLMGRYEVQILDSYENTTYYDGQCGAIYKQVVPSVNACKPPGQWQAYDIIFESPRWDEEKKLVKKANVTVLQNGVVLHHKHEYLGTTPHRQNGTYNNPHPPEVYIELQDHHNPMRFRNIWLRQLGQYDKP